MSQQVELRAHARAPLALEIDLESESNFYTGLSSDIGEGGIFVGTHVLPAIGERLEMDLKLPHTAKTFRISGVVRWLRDLRVDCEGVPSGFGMQWIDLSTDAAASIRSFVAQRETIFFEAA